MSSTYIHQTQMTTHQLFLLFFDRASSRLHDYIIKYRLNIKYDIKM